MGALVYVRNDGPDHAEIVMPRGRRLLIAPGEELRISLAKDANLRLGHLDTVIDHGAHNPVSDACRHAED